MLTHIQDATSLSRAKAYDGQERSKLQPKNPNLATQSLTTRSKDILSLLPTFRPLNEKPSLKERAIKKEHISSIKPRYRKEDKSSINRKLYYDVFKIVLDHLEASDLISCSEVCVRWNGVIKEDKEAQKKITLLKKYVAKIAPHKIIGFDHWRYHIERRTKYVFPCFVDLSPDNGAPLTDVNEALLFFVAQRFRARDHRPIPAKVIMEKTGVNEWRSLTPIEYVKFLKNPVRQEIFGKTWRRLGFPKNARDLGERVFCNLEAKVGKKVYRISDDDRYRILIGYIERQVLKLSTKKQLELLGQPVRTDINNQLVSGPATVAV